MADFGRSPPTAAQRLRDHWRGLWGRGDARLSSHRQAEVAHQLRFDNADGPASGSACPICRLRVGSCGDWLADLPLTDYGDTAARGAPRLLYCPRHLRLLLDAPNGPRHLRDVLPGLLDAARAALQTPGGTLGPVADPRDCPACLRENQTENQSVRAAAELPPTTGDLPGLSQLAFCHEHTLRIAARIVGRFGPEPRAIPDLRVLVGSHRRRLQHLIAGDGRVHPTHGREVVAVCDADVALASYPRLVDDRRRPPPHLCRVCIAAADATHFVVSETVKQLIQSAAQRRHSPVASLCRAHLRDLINHSRGEHDADNSTVLAGIAQAQMAQLRPLLDWLDSGFAHPHTIRHVVSELVNSRPCPACTVHLEGERHVLATLTATGDLATQGTGQPPPICLRHGLQIAPEHPARIWLADQPLRLAAGLLHDLPAAHRLATTPDADRAAETADSPAAGDRGGSAALVHALGLLDGRIHLDTAGVADDMGPQ